MIVVLVDKLGVAVVDEARCEALVDRESSLRTIKPTSL